MKTLKCVYTGLRCYVPNEYDDAELGYFSADMFYSFMDRAFVIVGMGLSKHYDVTPEAMESVSFYYQGSLYLTLKDFDYLQRNMSGVLGARCTLDGVPGERIKVAIPVIHISRNSRADFCLLYGYAE